MKKDSLGDRMKGYESVYKHKAVRRVPLMVRVDGKAFHTLTKKATKPFDHRIMDSMLHATVQTAKKIQGFKVAYVQSDEATFLITDYDTIETDAWFGYDQQKIVSIVASYMSVFFDEALRHTDFDFEEPAVFDARAFTVPKEDVVNCFLWRAKDWKRNSLQMYAQSFFSHKQLHGKNQAAMHEMLHDINKNWTTDLKPSEKNGVFLYQEDGQLMQNPLVMPDYESVLKVIWRYL